MLKEIFLINRSVLQFHYSSEQSSSEDDKAVLSSGFLSAIQDFSTHARSDVLDSFSTESEYFLYSRFPQSEEVLIGVFDRKAPEKFAREAIQKIMEIFREIPLPEIEGLQWSPEVKNKIREKLSRINVQFFSNEKLSSVVLESLEERTDIPLAFLIDSGSNSLIASFSRPKPLFKEDQVREFLLVHSSLQRTLETLGIDAPYSYLVIESEDYAVVACNGGRLLSVASGSMRIPVENVYNAATNICYADTLKVEFELSAKQNPIGRLMLGENGRILISSGRQFPMKSHIFISTLAKNVESMFKLITRRPYTRFFARTKGDNAQTLFLRKTSSGIEFEMYQL
ncbi:MAG: hypothetical protein OEV85_05505 [Candidatus Thorarchaeota archaeon]|nr:hypothetical protein [Candidatus Thorarchaeota archaeon]